jgi:hypothetical protein
MNPGLPCRSIDLTIEPIIMRDVQNAVPQLGSSKGDQISKSNSASANYGWRFLHGQTRSHMVNRMLGLNLSNKVTFFRSMSAWLEDMKVNSGKWTLPIVWRIQRMLSSHEWISKLALMNERTFATRSAFAKVSSDRISSILPMFLMVLLLSASSDSCATLCVYDG